MTENTKPVTILVADDDEDDCLLLRETFRETGFQGELRFVEDGEELIDYLNQRGAYRDSTLSPRPDLILLDLNMPRKDGREALREIKSDPNLRLIPVVILTTSREERDILLGYKNGASSFITKPDSFALWKEMVRSIMTYWFGLSCLPESERYRAHRVE